MIPYNKAIADYMTEFLEAVYTLRGARNQSPGGEGDEIAGERGRVPASADAEKRYRLCLDRVPVALKGMKITVGGEARTAVPYGKPPAAGKVGVSVTSGMLEFHASDKEKAVVADYTGQGTPVVMSGGKPQIGEADLNLNTQLVEALRMLRVVVTESIGVLVQPYDTDLEAIAALPCTDSNIIAGNGTTWVAESGATARASLDVIQRVATTVDNGVPRFNGTAGEMKTSSVVAADGALNPATSGGLTLGTSALPWGKIYTTGPATVDTAGKRHLVLDGGEVKTMATAGKSDVIVLKDSNDALLELTFTNGLLTGVSPKLRRDSQKK